MIGVQLIGKESVISAYSDVGCDTWAILQGKQFVISGDNEGDLGTWLGRFTQGGSTATYTLRCYDTDSAPDSLTAGTNFVASFNFKLIDMYAGAGIAGHNTKLVGRIEELEKKLKDADGEEEPDIMSAIMGWLNDPQKLQMAVGAFKMLFGSNAGGTLPMPAPQGVAGFSGTPKNQEEALQRLAAVIDRLEKKDPQIVEHLEKLADIAERKPDTFKFLISNLNGL